MPQTSTPRPAEVHVEDVEVRGHIIDSLILPKILDCIMSSGATFRFKEIKIGQARTDPSFARIEIRADNEELLDHVLALIADHGASPVDAGDCQLADADIAGAFPEGFYSTTNQRTEVRLAGKWAPVDDQEMDCGILIDRSRGAARCIPMNEVVVGDVIVMGHEGVRVFPEERPRDAETFGFMNSAVSTEKPKELAIRRIAHELAENRRSGGKTLIVAGPAVVHTGSGECLQEMIRMGCVDVLFAGNALATHDIEQSLFGTSLGVYLDEGNPAEAGHAHHLRHQPHPPRRQHPPGRRAGRPRLGNHVRVHPPRHRVRPLRQHPRRRPPARRNHRRAGGPEGDARKAARRDVLPDDRHDAALDRCR